MSQIYYPAMFKAGAFHCPYSNCSVFSKQTWSARVNVQTDMRPGYGVFFPVLNLFISRCNHCNQDAIWIDGKLIFPESNMAPLPNSDMPDNVKKDYMEAALISGKSPRGAAALLRLAIQKLCVHIGQSDENLNTAIANLLKDGLPVRIQKALDIVRVIGNNAVHPGVIDLNDEPETVFALFSLINQIVQDRITQPKEIEALYEALPGGAKKAVEERDTQKPKQ